MQQITVGDITIKKRVLDKYWDLVEECVFENAPHIKVFKLRDLAETFYAMGFFDKEVDEPHKEIFVVLRESDNIEDMRVI